MMSSPGFIPSLIWGVITISLLVFVHEGGHYLAARLCGLEVSEFMLGLPGPKLSWKRGNTLYGVTAIPFGGYCRIPALEGSGPAAELGVMTEEERAVYASVPMWKRVVVLLAGVVTNLLLAIVVLTLALTLWGQYVDRGFVSPAPGGPAAAAGLPDGVQLLSIDGVGISDFNDIVAVVETREAGDVVEVRYRDEETGDETAKTAMVTLTAYPDDDPTSSVYQPRPYLGVSPRYVRERQPVLVAIAQSFDYLRLTAQGILNLFNPMTFRQTIGESASVVGIAIIAAEAAKNGPWEYATLVAVISLSLGLMNLLPIPPLDGGKILMELIQKATGRPLKQGLVIGVSMAGLVLLVGFMIFVTYNDIARLLQ